MMHGQKNIKSHGRVLFEEFLGTADKLPATSP